MIRFLSSLLLCALFVALPAHAATSSAARYFEGEIRFEKVGGSPACQRHVGKTREVELSLSRPRNAKEATTGWIVIAGAAPGRLEGGKAGALKVIYNVHDTHLNTPTELVLTVVGDTLVGTLRETPTALGFREAVCFWEEARLSLTDAGAHADIDQKRREHVAWYAAHGHESRGDYHARHDQFAEAAAAVDQAIAAVDGVLPETRTDFKQLLDTAARHYEQANDHERAAQRYRRLAAISVRQSALGIEDPALYHGWLRLATYLHLAKHTDEAITVIERAERLEGKAAKVDLDSRLLRLQLQGSLYVDAGMFDKAQASLQEEVTLATAEAGPDDLRTFNARTRSARVFRSMKDNPRFEAAFEPLTREITVRFGEAHELASDSNRLLGLHYWQTDRAEKARPWLEAAMRGYVALTDSTADAIKSDEDARYVMAALLDIYINQGLVARNFVERVKAGQASLDDLPFGAPMRSGSGAGQGAIKPHDWDRLLQR